jgi:adenylate cyclase
MNEEGFKRKLTAILSADVEGYSRLMGQNEEQTIRTLTSYRTVISDLVQKYRGRVVDTPGDNILAEFSSVVDAVESAVQIQTELTERNAELPMEQRMQFRIGINLGDVVEEEGRIYGDGVNIAARVESMADAGGICISGTVYDHVENKLDCKYDYLGEKEVKNISRPIRVYNLLMKAEGSTAVASEEKVAFPLPDKPSIAVLPFDNMSGDPEQEYFSDGLTEQIINGLCKVSNLFVIARNSSFAYKGKSINIRQIGRDLGVRYICEGSIQKAGNRVRITAQLIDATTDYHVWSENYDRELSDIFALQDEITMKLIDIMQIKLTFGEQAQLWAEKTANINAYDKCMRGIEYLYRVNEKDNAQARRLFLDAIDSDGKYGFPYVMVGFTHMADLSNGWTESPLTSFDQAEKFIGKALDLTDDLDVAHSLSGWIHLFKRQHEEAKKEGERAIMLNPNGAEAHALLAFILSYNGESKEAIRLLKKAFRLNPIPPSYYYYFLGIAYRNDKQYEKSIEICKNGIELDPDVLGIYTTLVPSCIMLNRFDEAKMYAKEILRLHPNYSLSYHRNTVPFKDQTETEALIDSLRKAGLPE